MSMRIAVLIPARNEESYIVDALESVAAQSRAPDEIVVVDDGSTDDTCRLVSEWSARRDMAIDLIRQRQLGVAAARNRGLQNLRADVVALLDADDLFLPDHLERAEAAMDRYPEVVLYFADVAVASQGKITRESFLANRQLAEVTVENVANGLRRIGSSSYSKLIRGNFVPVSTSVYRVSALRSIGLFDETFVNAADREINLRLTRLGDFVYDPHRGGTMRRRPGSLQLADPVRAQRHRFLVIKKMLDTRAELRLSRQEAETTRDALAEQSHAVMATAAKSGWSAYKSARRFLRQNGMRYRTLDPKNMMRILRHGVRIVGRSGSGWQRKSVST